MAQQQFQGPDGTIYEEVPGGGYRVVSPPQAQGVVTKQADPARQYAAPLAAADLEAKRNQAALSPYQIQKAQADALKAQADAAQAQREAEAGGNNPHQAQQQKDLSLDEVLTAIDTARGQISGWSTGFGGKHLQGIGGTQADDLHGTISTIGSRVTQDVLSQLKSQSATGASGFGALSEREGEMLRNSVASLDQTQSAEQLQRNLDNVEMHYRRIKAIQAGQDPSDPKVQEAFGIGKKKDFSLSPQSNTSPPGAQPPPGSGGPTDRQSLTTKFYGDTGGPGGGLALSRDGFTTVPDPTRAGAISSLDRMLRSGVPGNRIMAFATALDADPASVAAALKFRHDNPSYKGSYNLKALGFKKVPVGLVQQGMNAAAQSPTGTFIANAGNAVTANNLDSIIGLTGGNADMARAGLTGISNANPKSAVAGNIAGGALAAAGLEAGVGGLAARAGLGAVGANGVRAASPWVARTADALYGAGAGAGNADDGNRLEGAGIGGVAGLGGGMFGRSVTRTAGALSRGVTDPAVTFLQRQGVPVTAGQALGGTAKSLEDKLTSFPILGDMITARRREGLRGFNGAAINEALAPIRPPVQGVGQSAIGNIGEQGIQDAQDVVSGAYGKALGGKMVSIDPQFGQDLGTAGRKIAGIPRLGPEVHSSINETMPPYFTPQGQLSGENMQPLIQELQGIRSAYAPDPLGNRVGGGVSDVQDAVAGLFNRQAPEVMPAFNAANQAYKGKSIVQDAVLAAKNTDGIFTPAQLNQAAVGNTVKFGGKNLAATPDRPFFDLGRAGQNVLPSKIPDSGTAGRMAVLGGLSVAGGLGGGATGGDLEHAGTGAGSTATGVLGAGALASLLYTKAGQKLLVNSLLKRPEIARKIGQQVIKAAPIGGMFGAASGTQLLPSQ